MWSSHERMWFGDQNYWIININTIANDVYFRRSRSIRGLLYGAVGCFISRRVCVTGEAGSSQRVRFAFPYGQAKPAFWRYRQEKLVELLFVGGLNRTFFKLVLKQSYDVVQSSLCRCKGTFICSMPQDHSLMMHAAPSHHLAIRAATSHYLTIHDFTFRWPTILGIFRLVKADWIR